jgi:hypothetical protein
MLRRQGSAFRVLCGLGHARASGEALGGGPCGQAGVPKGCGLCGIEAACRCPSQSAHQWRFLSRRFRSEKNRPRRYTSVVADAFSGQPLTPASRRTKHAPAGHCPGLRAADLDWAMWHVPFPIPRIGEADLRVNASRPFPGARPVHAGSGVQSSADLRSPAPAHIRAATGDDLKKRWQVSPTRGTSRTPRRSPTNG